MFYFFDMFNLIIYLSDYLSIYLFICLSVCLSVYLSIYLSNIILSYPSSTAQGGGGSFKKRKPIGKIGCCESGMAERSH